MMSALGSAAPRAHGSNADSRRSHYGVETTSVSYAISMDSTATSFPSDFRSVPVILVGNELFNVQTILGFAASSRSLTITVRRLMVFILISLYQSQKRLSLTKMPLRMVTLPTRARPGILIGANTGLL